MADYIVKGDEGYNTLSVTEIADGTPDFANINATSFDYEDISTSEMQRMWSASGGYIDAKKTSNTRVDNNYATMTGSIITGSGGTYDVLISTPHLYVLSFTWENYLYIMWLNASDTTDLINRLNGFNGLFPSSNTLYKNTIDSALQEDILSVDNEWDETPSDNNENPFNEDAIGGEFSDREPFDTTNNISLIDLEALLDNIATLDYGGLIQPIVLTQTEQLQRLTALNEGLFLANFWTNLKNKFNGLSDPLSMILDTTELPYMPAGNGGTMKLGGIEVQDGQGHPIPAYKLTRRYERKKVGSVTLKEVWGTEKDYSQCSVQIYLPYVGVRDIDTDLAINNTLTLEAVHDMWNGDVLYILHCSNKNSAYKYMTSEFVAYRWNGNCGKKVPLGRVDNTTPIMSLLSMAKNSAVGFASGGVVGALGMGGMTALNSNFNPTVQSSGNLSGSTGRMDIQYPYFILKRSVPIYPNNWRNEIGAPRYQEFQVSNLSGYTEFYEIHADDVSDATDSEKAEIENILKNGVFIA